MKIEVGKIQGTKEAAFFDVRTLVLTRLLLCANSGGGKSFLIRRLAELLCEIMPVVIFDPEGEFSTLREKFDFLLVGPGGETPADIRTAKLIMQKVLELRVSCVFDLSEMEPNDRHEFVKRACESAINSAKNLWNETAFIFDEAHLWCPESGKGSSVAKSAVLGFPTRGRKRNFMSIFATQRLHKLALDARAEMLNRMVGMTFEADDLDDAAKLLGIGKNEREAFNLQMRTMDAGNFYAFGRAISKETICLKVGPVKTSHEVGGENRSAFAPPPTRKIKGMLPQLADLPAQAQEEERNIEALREQVRELKEQIKLSKLPPAPVIKANRVEIPVLGKSEIKKLDKLINKFDKHVVAVNKASAIITQLQTQKDNLRDSILVIRDKMESFANGEVKPRPTGGYITDKTYKFVNVVDKNALREQVTSQEPVILNILKPKPRTEGDAKIGKGARECLIAIAQKPDGATDTEIAVLTGYKGTSRKEFRRQLTNAGYIASGGRQYVATASGLDFLGSDFKPLPTGAELRNHWLSMLSGGELSLYRQYIQAYPAEVPNDLMMQLTGYKGTSVKEFKRLLLARDVIVANRTGAKANPLLFNE